MGKLQGYSDLSTIPNSNMPLTASSTSSLLWMGALYSFNLISTCSLVSVFIFTVCVCSNSLSQLATTSLLALSSHPILVVNFSVDIISSSLTYPTWLCSFLLCSSYFICLMDLIGKALPSSSPFDIFTILLAWLVNIACACYVTHTMPLIAVTHKATSPLQGCIFLQVLSERFYFIILSSFPAYFYQILPSYVNDNHYQRWLSNAGLNFNWTLCWPSKDHLSTDLWTLFVPPIFTRSHTILVIVIFILSAWLIIMSGLFNYSCSIKLLYQSSLIKDTDGTVAIEALIAFSLTTASQVSSLSWLNKENTLAIFLLWQCLPGLLDMGAGNKKNAHHLHSTVPNHLYLLCSTQQPFWGLFSLFLMGQSFLRWLGPQQNQHSLLG